VEDIVSAIEDLNEKIAELEAEFWPLVREGKYETPEARALAERVRELKDRRAATMRPDANDEA
jgi:hypothetical protein